jgi:hypothetical protein
VERSAETTRDDPEGEYLKRNRWFESGSLQRGVRCEPDFRGRIPPMASVISPGPLISGQRDVECDDTHRAGAVVKFVVNTVNHFDVSRLAHFLIACGRPCSLPRVARSCRRSQAKRSRDARRSRSWTSAARGFATTARRRRAPLCSDPESCTPPRLPILVISGETCPSSTGQGRDEELNDESILGSGRDPLGEG